MMSRLRRLTAMLVALAVGTVGSMQGVQAAVIGTEEIAQAQAEITLGSSHAQLLSLLDRADVVTALQERGVDADAARDRVATLTDAEARDLIAQIDQAPAGADVLGVVVFLFVLLLVTDIMGFTKVFPFTRSIR